MDHAWSPPRAPLKSALVLALVGAGSQFLLVAGSLNGGAVSGLEPRAWLAAVQTPVGVLSLGAVALVFYALISLLVPRARGAAVVALTAAAVALALRSHPAATRLWWGMGAIAIHVAVAVLRAGMLAHLVVVLWRGRASLPPKVLRAAVRRYARVAWWSVLVVLLSGLGTALAVIGSVSQVVTTGYGRILLAKTALVALTLCLALVARVRGLRRASTALLPLVCLSSLTHSLCIAVQASLARV